MGLLEAMNVVGGAVIYATGGSGVGLVAPWLGFSSAAIKGGSQVVAAIEDDSQAAAAPQSDAGNLDAGSINSKSAAAATGAPKEQKQ